MQFFLSCKIIILMGYWSAIEKFALLYLKGTKPIT